MEATIHLPPFSHLISNLLVKCLYFYLYFLRPPRPPLPVLYVHFRFQFSIACFTWFFHFLFPLLSSNHISRNNRGLETGTHPVPGPWIRQSMPYRGSEERALQSEWWKVKSKITEITKTKKRIVSYRGSEERALQSK